MCDLRPARRRQPACLATWGGKVAEVRLSSAPERPVMAPRGVIIEIPVSGRLANPPLVEVQVVRISGCGCSDGSEYEKSNNGFHDDSSGIYVGSFVRP